MQTIATFDTISADDLARASGGFGAQLTAAMHRATQLGPRPVQSRRLQPRGFSNAELRTQLAPMLGLPLEEFSQGRMTYNLRRLRLHGLIERIPKSHRYQVTEFGLRSAQAAQVGIAGSRTDVRRGLGPARSGGGAD
ncbi:MAG TPA: hypothetical protein VHN14_20405 [Kofleriaceae bacterium]|jgi:hypothetical protein|nr:hypothetical protein [Kofleriaceae bacterium]